MALFVQVAIPAVTARAIDNALVARSNPLLPYVLVLIGLGVTRGVLAFTYRYGLYRMAYFIETDLRSVVYRHLTRMSFSFYDRVQSGQLISRANSDIRSVQMFLAFAPLIMVQCSASLSSRSRVMLTINVAAHARRVSTMPFVYFLGVTHAQADVPGVVGHPGPPRRRRHRRRRERQRRARGQVVRGRGAASSTARPAAADACEWANVEGRRHPGPLGAAHARTCPASARRSCCSTAGSSPSTASDRRRHRRVQRLRPDAAAAVPPCSA